MRFFKKALIVVKIEDLTLNLAVALADAFVTTAIIKSLADLIHQRR